MEIKITGWGYKNIRFLNTLEVNLLKENDKLPCITLVMMKNGTGKTTTKDLMRAVISGNASEWTVADVREFRDPNSKEQYGEFYVNIRFNQIKYRYTLTLDYENGTVEYKTTSVELGGMNDGHILPPNMQHILNSKGFVERFIFDGEQAKITLSNTSSEAEQAILYLYQIDKLYNLINRIEGLVQKKQTEFESSAATIQIVRSLQTKADNLETIMSNLKEDHNRLKESIADLVERRKYE